MSAAFKNAKKQVSKTELRRYMSEHKNKQKSTQKIESPLAKYTESGQLMCVLCKSVVRSESVWKVHINAKQHKENIEIAKKLKEQTNNFTAAPKRPISPEIINTTPAKKIKGILKNATVSPAAKIPGDFFDSDPKKETKLAQNEPAKKSDEKLAKETQMEVENVGKTNSEILPEGFFDDPKLDAKARNLEYKDPVEEEWERFQKEIKEVDNKSAEIIAEDQEEATTERQIDEIEEQMRNWSRVLDLEKKKEVVKVVSTEDSKKENAESSEEEDENFDEFLDWRSKKSFK